MVHAYQTHINSGSASLIRNFEVGVVQTLPRIQKSESVEKQIRTRIGPQDSVSFLIQHSRITRLAFLALL